MKWQPGKSPLQQLMQNSRRQAQMQWQRRRGGGWWSQKQKERWLQQQAAKRKLHFTPSAAIGETWVEFNTKHENQKGMHIHIAFSVANLRYRTGTVAAYFFLANGEPLKDFNRKYWTIGGEVCVARPFIPGYQNTSYGDFVLFMPYYELHMKAGNHKLKFSVSIWDDDDRELARSKWIPFRYRST